MTMTGETDIQTLDATTVARIAAGEVVERPASAVKELVENSLDADASRIDVTIEAGGTDLIRVADDGHGMTEADLRAAVRQHTTSKIESVDDLESGVTTLGFRGEALHTIGSVARLTIESRPRAGDDHGTKLIYEGGEVTSVEPTGCPAGTAVEVTDLFYNTPARRKFLKTTATEFAHVNRVVTRYALANPDVAVSLTHDGREVFATTGQGNLQAAVLAVYGRDVAQAMIPVDADQAEGDGNGGESRGDKLPPGPLESVTGLVSHPETNRSSREYLATYVNGRAVTADAIREGVMGAYGAQLGGDRYPFVVLFLSVPGETIDVNVHPRKREVRFDDDDAVRRQVEGAVKSALLEAGLLRSKAPRGRSAPAETEIAPEQSETEQSETEQPRDGTAGESTPADRPQSTASRSESTAGVSSSAEGDGGSSAESKAEAGAGSTSSPNPGPEAEPNADHRETTGSADSRSTVSASTENQSPRGATSPETEPGSEPEPESKSKPEAKTEPNSNRKPNSRTEPQQKFTEPTDQRTLEGEAVDAEQAYDSLPPLRVLGQLHDTYLVCESPDGLVLIDQHAADERVNYERLREAFGSETTAQALASPVELELTAAEAETFGHYREALAQLGFRAERAGDRRVAVTAVPAVLEKTLEPDQLRDVLSAVVSGDERAGSETVDTLAQQFLGDLACYPSITGNTSLTEGSVLDLLSALDACDNPYACPHGRPVIVSLERDDLEARFERDYPGHGG